jgi:hypothetical protein
VGVWEGIRTHSRPRARTMEPMGRGVGMGVVGGMVRET